MTEPTEKDIAAHVSALFLTEMVRECFSGNVSEVGAVVIEGLSKAATMSEVFEGISDLASEAGSSHTFNTKSMEMQHPEECIRIAELLAQGMEKGYGSLEKMLAAYEFAPIGKNPMVSSALEHQGAPGLARIIRPTLN